MFKRISRRHFLAGGVAAMLTGIAAYGYGFETGWVDLVQAPVTLPNLAATFHGYRIAQISDIHIGTAVKPDDLLAVVSLVNEQKPDLITITGDFVTYQPEQFFQPLSGALKQLTAPDGVIGVLGNHDYWTDSQTVRRIIGASDIIELSNDVYTIERGQSVLNIAGVDDVWEGHDRLDQVLTRLPATGAAILLAHEPDFADTSAATERFDLQLSGHSHGGQIILPVIGPPIVPPYAWKYPLGRYQVGKMIQYTNRGLGTTRLQVRINCRPEITIFTLQSILD